MVEKRKHTRVSVAVDIDFRSDSNFFTAKTRDISVGGLFIETDVGLSIGAHVAVSLHLLGKSYVVNSEVAWVKAEGGVTRGVGVRFLDLHAATRRTIEAFMALRAPMHVDAEVAAAK